MIRGAVFGGVVAVLMPVVAVAQGAAPGAKGGAAAKAGAPAGKDAGTAPPEEGTAAKARTDEAPQAQRAIVHGLHGTARVGGGYVLMNRTVPDPFDSTRTVNERLGGSFSVGLDLGFDITDFVALQLVGGVNLLSGTRTDRVRDVAMYLGGVVVRFSFGIDERLRAIVAPGAAFVGANNGVDESTSGAAVLLRAGVEYYVHIRHFSVGLELDAVLPTSPLRLVLGLQPSLKYTF